MPIFDLGAGPADSKKDSRDEQEVFWNFLEKFGRDSGSSSERAKFEEEETVNHRSSSRGVDSFSDHFHRKSEFGSKPQKTPQEKFLIKEAPEEESSRRPAPQPTAPQKVTAETQTWVKQAQRQPRKAERAEESGHSRLTFRKFREVEDESSRYPRRAARECGRLKFWENEKIDYRLGGYWVNEKEK